MVSVYRVGSGWRRFSDVPCPGVPWDLLRSSEAGGIG